MSRVQEILATNVKITRNRLGLSQARLAEICELSTSFIGEIELGKKFPSAQNFERLSEALGLRPYQLLYEKEEWTIYDKYDNIADMKTEFKEKINLLVEDIIRKHLRK
jgi:transcriptional regulator with XRE-family HTH domain